MAHEPMAVTSNPSIDEEVRKILSEIGLARWGVAPVGRPSHYHDYVEWIEQGHHGEMEYLKRHLPLKEDPRRLLPTARCVIVALAPYEPPHPHHEERWEEVAISLYAQGQDYHVWLRELLSKATARLSSLFPKEDFRIEIDSGPLMERDLAVQANLGWIGKNSCLLTPQGSLFFIGSILTSLNLQPSEPSPKPHCGTCTACLEVCPTGAFIKPYTMDARRCISYLTIESKSAPDLELIKNWPVTFFGCDLCQQVCPWNRKKFPPHGSTVSQPKLISLLRLILTGSNRQILRSLRTWGLPEDSIDLGEKGISPLARAGAQGLKRNAILLVGRLQLKELKGEIESLVHHPRWGELALETLKML